MSQAVTKKPRELDAETRAVELQSLTMSRLTATRLAYAGIRTLGDLSDWSGPDRRLWHITGITRNRACRIEKAVEAFWGQRETTTEATH